MHLGVCGQRLRQTDGCCCGAFLLCVYWLPEIQFLPSAFVLRDLMQQRSLLHPPPRSRCSCVWPRCRALGPRTHDKIGDSVLWCRYSWQGCEAGRRAPGPLWPAGVSSAGRKLLWRKCCPSGMMGEGLGGLCGRWWGGSEDQETVKAPPGAAKWVSAASWSMWLGCPVGWRILHLAFSRITGRPRFLWALLFRVALLLGVQSAHVLRPPCSSPWPSRP